MIGAIIFTALAIVLWLVYAYKTCVNWRHSSALPPEAPGGRPFVGHYFTFGSGELELPVKKLSKMAEDQGSSLVTVKMGFRNMVVVNDFHTAVAATKGGGFNARPLTLASVFSQGGVVNTEGDTWAANRKFCARKLKDAGFGCHATEELCLSEVKDYLVKLKERSNIPYDFRLDLQETIANVIGTVLVGPVFRKKSLASDLPDIGQVMANFCPADPRSVAPELRFMNMLARTTAIPKLILANSRLKRYIRSLVDEAREASKDGTSSSNVGLIGSYLAEEQRQSSSHPSSGLKGICKRRTAVGQVSAAARKASEAGVITCGHLDVEAQQEKHWEHLLAGRNHIDAVAWDFLVKGVDSLSSALSWVLYVLCRHQGVQQKMFKEIQAVGGNTSRIPRYEERDKLPYTRAVLSEAARLYPVVPATILCSVDKTKKTERLDSYDVPRGTPVYINVWAALRDPHMWTNPHEFSPERFLDASGNFRQPTTQPYCPFGVGKRTCLGEALATQLLFIFSTAIVQTYRIAFADAHMTLLTDASQDVSVDSQNNTEARVIVEEGELNYTYAPRPFKLLLTSREDNANVESPT